MIELIEYVYEEIWGNIDIFKNIGENIRGI